MNSLMFYKKNYAKCAGYVISYLYIYTQSFRLSSQSFGTNQRVLNSTVSHTQDIFLFCSVFSLCCSVFPTGITGWMAKVTCKDCLLLFSCQTKSCVFLLLESQWLLKTQVYSTGQLTPPFPIPLFITLVEFYLILDCKFIILLSVCKILYKIKTQYCLRKLGLLFPYVLEHKHVCCSQISPTFYPHPSFM